MKNELSILMAAGHPRAEAERHIRIGVSIYEAEDLEQNAERYISEWDLECEDDMVDDFRQMITTHKPAGSFRDWSYVELDGSRYYIDYFL